MNLPKKLILLPTIALIFVGGSVAAYALKPEVGPKRVEVQQVAAVEPVEAQAPAVESPPAVVEQVAQEPAPEPPKTADELKALSAAWITDNNKCGMYSEYDPKCPSEQANCFNLAIQMRYGWGSSSITEQFITSKLSELHDAYIGMCPALDLLKSRTGHALDNTYDTLDLPVDFANYPPGFRD